MYETCEKGKGLAASEAVEFRIGSVVGTELSLDDLRRWLTGWGPCASATGCGAHVVVTRSPGQRPRLRTKSWAARVFLAKCSRLLSFRLSLASWEGPGGWAAADGGRPGRAKVRCGAAGRGGGGICPESPAPSRRGLPRPAARGPRPPRAGGGPPPPGRSLTAGRGGGPWAPPLGGRADPRPGVGPERRGNPAMMPPGPPRPRPPGPGGRLGRPSPLTSFKVKEVTARWGRSGRGRRSRGRGGARRRGGGADAAAGAVRGARHGADGRRQAAAHGGVGEDRREGHG